MLRLAGAALAVASVTVVGLLAAPGRSRPTGAQSSPQTAQLPAGRGADPATGLIVGHVLEGLTDRPMTGVIVQLRGGAPAPPPAPGSPPSAPRAAISDGRGRFVFYGLTAGTYTVTVSNASGALPSGYGLRRPGGAPQPLTLAAGDRLGDVIVRAWRGASATGTLTDDRGDPVPETRVGSLRVETVAGRRRYMPGPTAMTDDRGVFRIIRLSTGDYTFYVPFQEITVPVSLQAAFDSAPGQNARQDLERSMPGVEPSSVNGSGFRIGDQTLVRNSNMIGIDGPVGTFFASPTPDESGHMLVYPFTYLPNVAALSSASVVHLEPGEERGDLNLQIQLVPAVRITGHVLAADGPGANVTVRLVPTTAADTGDEATLEAARAITNDAGDFTLLGVPAGQYVLKVARVPNTTRPSVTTQVRVGGLTMFSSNEPANLPPLPIPDTPTWNASMPLTVGDQDITGLSVTLANGARLSGHVEYDGSAAHLTADQLVHATITLDPADGGSFMGASSKGLFDADGQFRSLGLLPGRYLLRVGNVGPWSLLSAIVNGHDLADGAVSVETTDIPNIVITLTDHPASVAGTVRDGSGAPDGSAAVLLFPADRDQWLDEGASPRRERLARASAKGAYQMSAVPPGEYLVVAIDDAASDNWLDPKRLEALATRATRITVTAGDHHGLDLKSEAVR
jgi:hypothetical protein